ncbi:hypothetical protein [Alistipes putredinis]|mgnify:FL=1|uniref:hypothetical protein n=1 Tax=Alistipes putredinis TaxID=28117 RepID=UPI003A87BF0D
MKTLKLKKDVVSRLDREQSAMVKGGAGTTVIQQTKVCALTKQCETARCVSATGCKSDIVTACVEVTNDGCIYTQGGTCIQSECVCLETVKVTCDCE